MKRTSTFLSVIFLLAVMVLTITFSIGLPIYVRPFYYAHVDALKLPETYGIEREEIVKAYDEVLDYLTKDGYEFGTGSLAHSEEGKKHFEDCKVLFDLNKRAFIISLSVAIALFILDKIGAISLARPFGLTLGFFAGLTTLAIFATLAVVVAQDFSTAFTTFHQLFFPGKTNWIFNPYTDPIILFMPNRFFMDCAILIASSVIVTSIVLMVRSARNRYTA